MSTTKTIASLVAQLAGILGCHALGAESKEIAEILGISSGLSVAMGEGVFDMGKDLLKDKLKDDGKKFIDTKNHDFEKAVTAAYSKTFKALEAELVKEYDQAETTGQILLRRWFDISNDVHEQKEDRYNGFLAPLLSKLTNSDEIEKILNQNRFTDADEYLLKVIEETIPEYSEKYTAFVADVAARFKRIYRHHFLQELKHNDKAKTVYFCSLLEANLKTGHENTELLKRIVHEMALGRDADEQYFASLYRLIDASRSQQSEHYKSLHAAITALTEPKLTTYERVGAIKPDQLMYLFDFKEQYTDFVGREAEKSKLLEFAQHEDEDEKFKWWMVTAPGGAGKSRLAFEIAKTLRAMGWYAGFYSIHDKIQHNWGQWKAQWPTFIVIDYAQADTKKTKALITMLKTNEAHLQNPVRLLLLDRQMSPDWNEIFKTNAVGKSRYIKNDEYNVLELDKFTHSLWQIIDQVIELADIDEQRKEYLRNNRALYMHELHKIDEEGRPLFAFLAAKALVKGEDIKDWNVDELLDYHIARIKQEYWQKIEGYPSENHLIAKLHHLLAVNTLVKQLNEEEFAKTIAWLNLDEDATAPVYQKMTTSKKTKDKRVYEGMEPDIIGEYFVIDTFNQLVNTSRERAVALLQYAMQLKPSAFFDVAYKLWEDFYRRESFKLRDFDFEKLMTELVVRVGNDNNRLDLSYYYTRKGYYYHYIDPALSLSIENYEKANEVDPTNAQAYYNRGVLYQEQKEWKKAEDDYTKAIELNPNYAHAYINRGNLYQEQKKWEKAEDDYNRAIELNPNHALAYNNRGVLYDVQEEWKKAKDDYNRAIELDPNDAPAYYNRGNLYKELEEWKKAEDDYNRAIELNPNYLEAYVHRGNLYKKLEEWKKAEADYNKAIELNPNDTYAYNNRGNLYKKLKEWKKAEDDYNRAINLNPNYANAYFNRGSLYHNQKKWDKAEEDYSQAIELNPNDADAYYSRGNLYKVLKEWGKALADYNKAIELNPDNANIYNSKANCLVTLFHLAKDEEKKQQHIQQALEAARKVKELGGSPYNLACVYALMGEKTEAFVNLELSLAGEHISFEAVEQDKDWDMLRNEPEYLRLKEQYG